MWNCDSFDHSSLPKEKNLSSDDGLFLRRVSSCWCVHGGAASLARSSLTGRLWLSFRAGVFIIHTKPLNALAVSSAEEDCCVQEGVPQEDRVLCSSWEERKEMESWALSVPVTSIPGGRLPQTKPHLNAVGLNYYLKQKTKKEGKDHYLPRALCSSFLWFLRSSLQDQQSGVVSVLCAGPDSSLFSLSAALGALECCGVPEFWGGCDGREWPGCYWSVLKGSFILREQLWWGLSVCSQLNPI